MYNINQLNDIASQVRRDIIRMVTDAQSGHPGGSLSSADVMTALFFRVLKHDPANWCRKGRGNDMFFLSAGHISPVKELSTFRKFGTRLQGHPSIDHNLPGVYEAAGSLGQGLSVAIGAALSKKIDNDPNYVYTLLGDGEQEEGQVWEAAMFGAHHKVDNLIAITDWNHQQIDGNINDVAGVGALNKKWEAFGWQVIVTDGHNMEKIISALEEAKKLAKQHCSPVMVLLKTEMGEGVDFMRGTNEWHGKAPKPEQAEKALAQLKETLGDY